MLVLFEDGVCEEVEAERLEGDRWRLLSTPLATSSNVRRDDVVVLREDGRIFRFEKIAKAAPYVTIELVMSEAVIRAEGLRALFERVEETGGQWERAHGGVVLLHVPPERAAEIQSMRDALSGEGSDA